MAQSWEQSNTLQDTKQQEIEEWESHRYGGVRCMTGSPWTNLSPPDGLWLLQRGRHQLLQRLSCGCGVGLRRGRRRIGRGPYSDKGHLSPACDCTLLAAIASMTAASHASQP